ncbi:hypothetical protein ACFL6O_01185 [candidate division KSB1 bacterium]
MERLIEELTGLSTSIAVYGFYHLEYHIEQARKLGANESQILSAVKVGLSKMEILDYRMINAINTILPELSLSEIVNSVRNNGFYWIRILI